MAFVISEDGIEFSLLGEERLHWANAQSDVVGNNVRFVATGAHNIVIEVQNDSCSDSMSGAFHGNSAHVQLDGRETFLGCVIRGTGLGPPATNP